jgi:hypothetical protein
MSAFRFRGECKFVNKTDMQTFAKDEFWEGNVTALRKLTKDELCKLIHKHLEQTSKREDPEATPKRVIPTFLYTLKGKKGAIRTKSPVRSPKKSSDEKKLDGGSYVSPILTLAKPHVTITRSPVKSPVKTPVKSPVRSPVKTYTYTRSPHRKTSQTTFEEFGIAIPKFKERPPKKSPGYRQLPITQFMKKAPKLSSPLKTKKVEKQLTLKDLWKRPSTPPQRPKLRLPPPVEEYLMMTPPKKQLRFASKEDRYEYSIPSSHTSSSESEIDSPWSTPEKSPKRNSPRNLAPMLANPNDYLFYMDSPVYSDRPLSKKYQIEGSLPDELFLMDGPIYSQE